MHQHFAAGRAPTTAADKAGTDHTTAVSGQVAESLHHLLAAQTRPEDLSPCLRARRTRSAAGYGEERGDGRRGYGEELSCLHGCSLERASGKRAEEQVARGWVYTAWEAVKQPRRARAACARARAGRRGWLTTSFNSLDGQTSDWDDRSKYLKTYYYSTLQK
eukprot:scaffold31973_cov41-Tisochrysis_lutea.AAC.1